MMSYDFDTYLTDDIMTKVDRSTMSVGLEGREPLLDHRIIEFNSGLDPSYCRKRREKILKDIVSNYVPNSLIDRPKQGFSVPIGSWLVDFKDEFYDITNKSSIEKTGLFESNKVLNLIDNYYDGRKISDKLMWTIFVYFKWQNQWL